MRGVLLSSIPVLLAVLPASAATDLSSESRQVRAWLGSLGVHAGWEMPREMPAGFEVLSAHQDYRRPAPDMCCHTYTPLRIGSRSFEKGVGAHANGAIVVRLLEDFVRFAAYVGIDNNEDTKGARGSARFVVKVDGEERFRSPVCRGGEEPVKVEVGLSGASQLELILEDAGDGYSYDQADWAEAALVTGDGTRRYIGDALPGAAATVFVDAPTRFAYGGKDCWALFGGWHREDAAAEPAPGGQRYSTTWTEPETGFRATLLATVFETPPAVELQWRFENTGAAPSAVIADVRSLDLRALGAEGAAELVSCRGGTTGNLSNEPGFEIIRTRLGKRRLTVTDGRSSNGDLPFYMLQGLRGGWGVVAALGWSGGWRAEARFDKALDRVVLEAGMTPVRFRLPSRETVSLPTALLVPFRGGAAKGSNRLRRLLREHYQAQLDGKPVPPPVSFNSWFVFDNNVNETMLRELADEAAALGLEYFCLDAGWFEGDFPHGVGNWTLDRSKFPNGLKAVADHVHGLGMKFGLWFEPERVSAGTRWAKEHPELLCGVVDPAAAADAATKARYLLDLGQPAARELVLSMMDGIIRDAGVDWIRYDFNIGPASIWAAAEGPGEQGLRQIRHINGLYTMLDDLMKRQPTLLIEQCSSGGRRIDLETIRRGHTFWKSDDTRDQPLMRFHETGGNVFLLAGHLNTNYCDFRSQGELLALFAGPLGFGADFRALTAVQKDFIRQAVAAYKQIRPYLNLDYYPLFSQTRSQETWNGWEFLDPDAQEGCFIVYRPQPSRYGQADMRLQGLAPERIYQLEELITGDTATATGQELATTFAVTLEPGAAQVWRLARE